LNIVSVDLDSRSLVISRNSHCPTLLHKPSWGPAEDAYGWRILDEPSEAIGIHARTKPVITELPLDANITVIVFTDGVWTAGRQYGDRLDIQSVVERLMEQGHSEPAALADCILAQAISLDRERPADDMSLVVVGIRPRGHEDQVRRMRVSFPI
jgi:serine phosphatase RsbU (regulator of sigma subunit)